MEIKVAKNDTKECVSRVEHIFKIVQFAAENEHSELGVGQENHQENDDEGGQVTKKRLVLYLKQVDSRAATSKSFCENSRALEVGEELV